MPRVVAGPADFARLLGALLPTGDAWPQDPGSVQRQAVAALARAFATLNARANDLIDDAFPATAVELLPEWERSLGLPDACSPLASTVTMRQRAVVSKLLSRGGQSVPYFLALASAYGQQARITQFAPFRAGASRAGDPDHDDRWAHVWQVSIPDQVQGYPFRAGTSYAGEPLDAYDAGTLECRLRQAAPAQSTLIFEYGSLPDDALTGFGDGQLLTGADRHVLTGRT